MRLQATKKSMAIPIGPHQRCGRRRRRGKALVLCIVLVIMAICSNVTVWDKPEPEPERARLEPSALGWMINRSAYSPGEAQAFADRYPELVDMFLNAKPLPVR